MGEEKQLRLEMFESGKGFQGTERLLLLLAVFLRKQPQSLGFQIDQRIPEDEGPLVQEGRLPWTEARQGYRLHASHRIAGWEALISDDVIPCILGCENRNAEALGKGKALPEAYKPGLAKARATGDRSNNATLKNIRANDYIGRCRFCSKFCHSTRKNGAKKNGANANKPANAAAGANAAAAAPAAPARGRSRAARPGTAARGRSQAPAAAAAAADAAADNLNV